MRDVYIVLGSNIGDKRDFIERASVLITKKIGHIKKYSSFYQTSPWGFDSTDEFLNRVICVSSDIEPSIIMKLLLDIENILGRIRNVKNEYLSRTIDLDILLIDDLILESDLLIVPHPRMKDRKFVLVPLSEIAPDIVHPIEKKKIHELLDNCSDNESVIKFK